MTFALFSGLLMSMWELVLFLKRFYQLTCSWLKSWFVVDYGATGASLLIEQHACSSASFIRATVAGRSRSRSEVSLKRTFSETCTQVCPLPPTRALGRRCTDPDKAMLLWAAQRGCCAPVAGALTL